MQQRHSTEITNSKDNVYESVIVESNKFTKKLAYSEREGALHTVDVLNEYYHLLFIGLKEFTGCISELAHNIIAIYIRCKT